MRLAALPMQKFFNLNENPSTIGLDLTQVDEILLKADGSLMSTYLHDNGAYLRIKSKGSLYSEQALAAMAWLENHPDFKDDLYEATLNGYTVNMEWCSPVHRIVIGYMEPHLKVLNMRHRGDGSYRSWFDMCAMFGEENVIERLLVDDPVAFVASIPAMTEDIEGYVVKLGPQWVKIKTEKYLSLHHAKDSVNNPRRLYEAILDEGIDDLRSLFYTDEVAMKMIDEMQDKVDHMYNHMVKLVEDFYTINKHLDRKDFAIKGQNDLERLYFGLAMTMYLGKPVDFKAFMKSKYKELGIRDTQTEGEK
jgi:RNA ligase